MSPTKDKQLREYFIETFLYGAYVNMEMEGEVSGAFDKDTLYQRYKVTVDQLIEEKCYLLPSYIKTYERYYNITL